MLLLLVTGLVFGLFLGRIVSASIADLTGLSELKGAVGLMVCFWGSALSVYLQFSGTEPMGCGMQAFFVVSKLLLLMGAGLGVGLYALLRYAYLADLEDCRS